MNKKIEEFAEQCYEKHELLGTYEFNKEKFAELIAKDCVELIRLQYVGDHVTGHEYRNRGLDAAEFVICLEYGIEKQKQPMEKFY